MRLLKIAVGIVLAVGLGIILARQIWPLPDISEREPVSAMDLNPATSLGQSVETAMEVHPGQSGVIDLSSGSDALGSRLALIDRAEESIDAQYYIWHDDLSGILLLDALKRAAARGVRVRLLLDDNGVPGLDQIMATLNAQLNFHIRLFNPSTVRQPKILGYSFDFLRMNRRMHNKSMIVDGAVAIVGGRNIGDEYFQIGQQFYADLDVMAVGQIVPETADAFDSYWNSASVFALEDIVTLPADLPQFESRVAELVPSPESVGQLTGARESAEKFMQGQLKPEWTDVELVVDDPIKGEGIASPEDLMIVRLGMILGDINERLDLVSAYFVPGQKGTEFFADRARDGTEVNILTNALDTTDVLMVHGGYTKYRRELLESGANLFELKLRGEHAVKDTQLNPFGLSGASLHAKTFAADRRRIFIGSFNFDPRSAMLNCEMGFLIDSPDMASRVSELFDGKLGEASYRPALTPEGNLVWRDRQGGHEQIYQREPGASWFQQVMLTIIGVLPVEWLL